MTPNRCAFLALVLTAWMQPAIATDEALLRVLLENKLISQQQFDVLIKGDAGVATAAADERKAPAANEGILDVLLANGLISQAQFDALNASEVEQRAAKPVSKEATVSLEDGFKARSADGDFQTQVGLVAQLDSAWYGDENTDFSDGTEIRRARLNVSGTVLRDWNYRLEADFAGLTTGGSTNNVTLTDAYVRYNGFRPISITAGSFKVPFSLEAVGSAKHMTFMERGLPVALLTQRALGGMIAGNGNNWTAAAGLFGETVTTQNVDDEGRGAAGRITWAPWFGHDRVLHLGIGGQWREPGQRYSVSSGTGAVSQIETVRFRSKPESNLLVDNRIDTSSAVTADGYTFGFSPGRVVDTGNIGGDVNYYTLIGAEVAGVLGPLSVQVEYIATDVDRETGRNPGFDGWYVFGSWFLTGESRNYLADRGVFDVIKPAKPFSLGGGPGAWELAARFSGLDLSNADVLGGDMHDLTVGLNWYPNSFVRVMANYVKVLDLNGGANHGENLDAFQIRTQVAY